jgi:hypothetical protein
MRLPSLALTCFVVVVALGAAAPAAAQFRNNGVQLPNVGYMGLGSTFDPAYDAITGDPSPWNTSDHATIGAGIFTALGYDLWFDNQAAIGMGLEIEVGNGRTDRAPVFSLSISSGLRYNFMNERIRPFVSTHVHYLQLINPGGATLPQNFFLEGQPFWVGLRGGGGIEWIFGDEMSVQIEAGLLGLFAPSSDGYFLPASTVRLAYQVYF